MKPTTHFLLLAVCVTISACGISQSLDECAKTCGGCCDSSGQCQAGLSQLSCGSQGLVCSACGANERCQSGKCSRINKGPGDPATGGTLSTGGSAQGGSVSMGGTVTTGGSPQGGAVAKGGGASTGGTVGQGGSTSGVTKLSVIKTWRGSYLKTQASASMKSFVRVTVRLENRESTSISPAPSRFALSLSTGLEYPFYAYSGQLDDGCPQDGEVTPGGTLECSLVMEIANSATPKDIYYTLESTTTRLQASAGSATCTACTGAPCVDLLTDPRHCGKCNSLTPPAVGQCVNGGLVCGGTLLKCNNMCIDPEYDANNCGACGKVIDSTGVCSQGVVYCNFSSNTHCGSTCVPTQTDPKNCGACGYVCGANSTCSAGVCSTTQQKTKTVTTKQSCTSVCSQYFAGSTCNTAIASFKSTSAGCTAKTKALTCATTPPNDDVVGDCGGTYGYFQSITCTCN